MLAMNRMGASIGALLALFTTIGCQDIIGELGQDDLGPDPDAGADGDAGSDQVCGWDKVVDPVDSMLTDVWGESASDVVAVGGPTALRFDGESWQPLGDQGPPPFQLVGVWGESIDDLFVVGFDADYGGKVARFDGESFSEMETGHLDPVPLGRVWGSSASDVYAVGPGSQSMYEDLIEGAKVIRFDGATWSVVEQVPASDSMTRFLDVWGSGPDDVFVLGEDVSTDQTLVYHFDGNDWSQMPTDQHWVYPGVIFGLDSENIFVSTGQWSTTKCVARFDGEQWVDFATCFDHQADEWLLEPELRGIWGTDTSKLYAIDGDQDVWSFGEDGWSLELLIDADRGDQRFYFARAIWGSSEDDVYVVGNAIWHLGCQVGGA